MKNNDKFQIAKAILTKNKVRGSTLPKAVKTVCQVQNI